MIYQFEFKASYLGGIAIVKALNVNAAWVSLSKRYDTLPPLNECKVKEIPDKWGVLYFWDGDY